MLSEICNYLLENGNFLPSPSTPTLATHDAAGKKQLKSYVAKDILQWCILQTSTITFQYTAGSGTA